MTQWISVIVLGLALAGCGAAEIGEDCESAGSTDDCVDGAICTNEDGTNNRCRQICDDVADCPSTPPHGCNGVSGSSTKSCQPD